MNQPLQVANHVDDDGNPAGGFVTGNGLSIRWQNGPLGRGAERQEPNGAFVEDVIEAARQRIQWYQDSGKFACDENHDALSGLDYALKRLNDRTARRENAGVEGTHEGS